jgi:hypothetical protein
MAKRNPYAPISLYERRIALLEAAPGAEATGAIERHTITPVGHAPAVEQPVMQCPRCKAWMPDFDGVGVLAHTSPPYEDGCGFCTHPSCDQDAEGHSVCGICSARTLHCESCDKDLGFAPLGLSGLTDDDRSVCTSDECLRRAHDSRPWKRHYFISSIFCERCGLSALPIPPRALAEADCNPTLCGACWHFMGCPRVQMHSTLESCAMQDPERCRPSCSCPQERPGTRPTSPLPEAGCVECGEATVITCFECDPPVHVCGAATCIVTLQGKHPQSPNLCTGLGTIDDDVPF